MRLSARIFSISAAVLIVLALAAWFIHNKKEGRLNLPNSNRAASGLQIISPAFRDGAAIPLQYSCKGQNVNPPLNILNVPAAAKSLALIMHDPDAPSDYVHWTIWDMPTSTETIAANSVPTGAIQGQNSNNENRYAGPCPPSGTHHYLFEIYALDKSLALPAETNRDGLKKAMESHIVGQHTLTGTFGS